MKKIDFSIYVVILAIWASGCRKNDQDCVNGVCTCEHGADCDIECKAPPCHAICMDKGTYCEAECGNGDCICEPKSKCDFYCYSPPCHVHCNGNSHCSGECANGDCNCSSGSNCTFNCLAGPCHVNCDGNHEMCDGVCANGSCNCGPNSSCSFSCLDSDCKASCASGSACTLECPDGNPGKDGCRFDYCAAGDAQICPDGRHTVCGTPCPTDLE